MAEHEPSSIDACVSLVLHNRPQDELDDVPRLKANAAASEPLNTKQSTSNGYASPSAEEEQFQFNLEMKTASTVSSHFSESSEEAAVPAVLMKTLLQLAYSEALIRRASRRLQRNKEVQNLTTMLTEVQKLDKEIFMKTTIHYSDSSQPSESSHASADDSVRPKIQQVVQKVAAKLHPDARVQAMKNELSCARSSRDAVRRRLTCYICETRPTQVLFLICRHFVTCAECGDRVRDCPLCHQDIAGTLDVFLC